MRLLIKNIIYGVLVSSLLCISMLLMTDLNELCIPLLIVTATLWIVFREIAKKILAYIVTNLVGGIITLVVIWLPFIQNWGTIASFPATCIALLVFLLDLIVYLLNPEDKNKTSSISESQASQSEALPK